MSCAPCSGPAAARLGGVLLVLALVLAGPPALAARAAHGERAPIERLRERLRARGDAEATRLQRNLQEFEKLPHEARLKLLRRARTLRERERNLEQSMPREARERLGAAEPERARELWRERLREHIRDRGHELRRRLPEGLRRRLEEASPELRRRYFERLTRERELGAPRLLHKIGRRLGVPETRIDEWRELPARERLRVMGELERRRQREGR